MKAKRVVEMPKERNPKGWECGLRQMLDDDDDFNRLSGERQQRIADRIIAFVKNAKKDGAI